MHWVEISSESILRLLSNYLSSIDVKGTKIVTTTTLNTTLNVPQRQPEREKTNQSAKETASDTDSHRINDAAGQQLSSQVLNKTTFTIGLS